MIQEWKLRSSDVRELGLTRRTLNPKRRQSYNSPRRFQPAGAVCANLYPLTYLTALFLPTSQLRNFLCLKRCPAPMFAFSAPHLSIPYQPPRPRLQFPTPTQSATKPSNPTLTLPNSHIVTCNQNNSAMVRRDTFSAVVVGTCHQHATHIKIFKISKSVHQHLMCRQAITRYVGLNTKYRSYEAHFAEYRYHSARRTGYGRSVPCTSCSHAGTSQLAQSFRRKVKDAPS